MGRQTTTQKSGHCSATQIKTMLGTHPHGQMLKRCQTKQLEASLVIKIKLITFETVGEWYRPKSDYDKPLQ